MVAVFGVATAIPAGAHASIRGDGATRNGDVPVVRQVLTVPETLHVAWLHRGTFGYGTDPAQRFDAYWPDVRRGRQPGILLLHGGYWLEGDKADWRRVARRLAARGYAVFVANYRLSRQAPWPAQQEDAAAALGFIQRHAARFQLDPGRMVVLGSSAGGQIATVLGATGRGHLRGVVALSPVNAPYLAYVDGGLHGASRPERKLRHAVARLLRCTPTGALGIACLDRMRQATPQITTSAVPMLFVHSRGDFVPVEQSAAISDALSAAGVTADMKRVPGSAHGGGLLRSHRVYTMVVTWIDAVTGPDA
jgi:acetyl esterase/lipase